SAGAPHRAAGNRQGCAEMVAGQNGSSALDEPRACQGSREPFCDGMTRGHMRWMATQVVRGWNARNRYSSTYRPGPFRGAPTARPWPRAYRSQRLHPQPPASLAVRLKCDYAITRCKCFLVATEGVKRDTLAIPGRHIVRVERRRAVAQRQCSRGIALLP